MTLLTLALRNAVFHARGHLATVLGVMVGTATLTGALLVGDSMRGSLRERALERLGRAEHGLFAQRFFREALATEIETACNADGKRVVAAPLIALRGGITHATSRARAERAQIFGVDDRFWGLADRGATVGNPGDSRSVILNEPLARELGAAAGDDVLLRIGKFNTISAESLLGRRDDTTATLRLRVARVIPAAGIAGFSPQPAQRPPASAFVPLAALQSALEQPARVNAALFAPAESHSGPVALAHLQRLLAEQLDLSDIGLMIRPDAERGYVSFESDALLLPPALEAALERTVEKLGAPSTRLLAYLANDMRLARAQSAAPTTTGPAASIPYSVVVGVDRPSNLATPVGDKLAAIRPGTILLNEWAWQRLRPMRGNEIELTYYFTGRFGELETRTSRFAFENVVRMDAHGADPGLAPQYPGITDSPHIRDWDPPFPVDLRRVREEDEQYWQQHRAAPKAFVSLSDAIERFAEAPDRLGRLTAIRFYATPDRDLDALESHARAALRESVDAEQFGMRFQPLRNQALSAGAGSTDFAGLFLGFSMFLIAAGAMLVTLLFRLGVERRARELGLLLAVGFAPARVLRLLMLEGLAISAAGSAAGLLSAIGFAAVMIHGLKTWWADAANAPMLRLHVGAASLVIGALAGVALAMLSIGLALRGLTRLPTRALLAGHAAPLATRHSRTRSGIVAFVAAMVAVACAALSVATTALPPAIGFFLGGVASLVALLAAFRRLLARPPQRHLAANNASRGLAARNVAQSPGRSLLTVGLIASAAFVLIAVEAFRLDAPTDARSDPGTGGFTVMAESATPLLFDLETERGREALSLGSEAERLLTGAKVVPMRLRAGDETSCLNLYRPGEPRVLGVPVERMSAAARFRFGPTLAKSREERSNPWTLLDRPLPDGAIPVIGDEASVLWQLKSGLGREIRITDGGGQPATLRFVALLRGSVLQGELLVSERDFLRLFPATQGHSYFLIQPPARDAGHDAANDAALLTALERDLEPFAFDATRTVDRLRSLFAVQNTYLSAFQAIGSLGLLLGTAGLAVVMLRNLAERRRELALLRAVGFRPGRIGVLVLIENMALVSGGLALGYAAALFALVPEFLGGAGRAPWPAMLGLLLAAITITFGACLAALRPLLRAPIIESLRND